MAQGYKCQHCDKEYDKMSSLKEHLVGHLKTKEFVCETCGRAYRTNYQLKQHKQCHNNERQFKCCECDQVLKTIQTLKIHLVSFDRKKTSFPRYEEDK